MHFIADDFSDPNCTAHIYLHDGKLLKVTERSPSYFDIANAAQDWDDIPKDAGVQCDNPQGLIDALRLRNANKKREWFRDAAELESQIPGGLTCGVDFAGPKANVTIVIRVAIEVTITGEFYV